MVIRYNLRRLEQKQGGRRRGVHLRREWMNQPSALGGGGGMGGKRFPIDELFSFEFPISVHWNNFMAKLQLVPQGYTKLLY